MASNFREFWIGVKETALIMLAIFAALFLLLLVAAGYGLWWLSNASKLDMGRDEFNREVWLRGDGDHRCYMYKDLVKKHLKKGMMQEQMKELLGMPSYESYSATGEYKNIRYFLGSCDGHFSWSLEVVLHKTHGVKFVYNNHEKSKPEIPDFKASCYPPEKECWCWGDGYRKVEFKNIEQECGVKVW